MNGELADLIRDIRLPEPDFWWPPAPGWWVLGGGLILVVAGLAWFFYWKGRLRRAALGELERIRFRFEEDGDYRALAMALNMLLRRVAMARHSRRAVAPLHGRQWLEFLDRTGETAQFSRGAGRVLLEAPYVPQADFDARALLALVETWLRKSG